MVINYDFYDYYIESKFGLNEFPHKVHREKDFVIKYLNREEILISQMKYFDLVHIEGNFWADRQASKDGT